MVRTVRVFPSVARRGQHTRVRNKMRGGGWFQYTCMNPKTQSTTTGCCQDAQLCLWRQPARCPALPCTTHQGTGAIIHSTLSTLLRLLASQPVWSLAVFLDVETRML